ncbi:MAG: hypothetical protein H5U40_13770 [Polyangiaceae bacterium]|nr:hypothetical protein [Polyangiaceae bacterium]
MIELAIGLGVVAVATIAAVRSRSRGIAAPLPAPIPTPEPSEDRLGVGDVLLHLDDELWLAGSVSLQEAGCVLRLFPTPGGGRVEYVLELHQPSLRWAALRTTTAIDPGSVPESLRIDGLPLSLARRGLARVFATGEHLPHVTDRAEYAIFRGPGGRCAVVIDFAGGSRLALTGEELAPETFDRLPGSLVAGG